MNWAAYDIGSRQRGSLTVWFTEAYQHGTWRLPRARDGRNLMAAARAEAYKEGVQRAGRLSGCRPVRRAYLEM
jgi:hypothetical protein